MTLFVLSCKDGWVNIMYDGLDAVGVDQQVTAMALLTPVRNERKLNTCSLNVDEYLLPGPPSL